MNKYLTKLYHRLPSGFRNVAASARGIYLSNWRYGADAEALVETVLERDSWSAEQWRTYQHEKLAFILDYAATRVPYYRDQWAKRRANGDRASWEVMDNWMVLEKEALRANPHAFLSDDFKPNQLFHQSTSGTTGKPLSLYIDREALRYWYAVIEARIRRWNGVTRHQPWAIMGGQQVVPPGRTKPPYWVWNTAMNQLYLAANYLNPRHMRDYAGALERYGITHIYAYSSSVAYLAAEFVKQGIKVNAPIRAVFSNAEPLLTWQREVIQKAFNCTVRETYGMGEKVAAANEDSAGKLRLCPDIGVVEVFDNAFTAQTGMGDFVCTSLNNRGQPLIRYRVGDTGALDFVPGDAQPTGNIRLPVMTRIEGRTNDMLIGPNGNRVWWVNPIFYEQPIREAQIVQETVGHVHIRLIPAEGYTAASEAAIIERMRERLGDVRVEVEHVESIERTANGKLRAIISKVDPAQLPETIR